MPVRFDGKLVVAISSRALFDLEDSHRVFDAEGVEAYARFQREREDQPLAPGVAFALVRKLLALDEGPAGERRAEATAASESRAAPAPADAPRPGPSRATAPGVEVILLSRNSADTGLRVFNSIEHHGLAISRAAFTGGEAPYRYVKPFGAHLFLSADPRDVRAALESGYAAATILPAAARAGRADLPRELRIAFDGDAVIFSDDAERVFKSHGLEAFSRSEREAARDPLPGGPFRSFLAALHHIQASYPAGDAPIRTALVTARGAPAHERVIRTLRAWGIRIDQALFLGGMAKGEFLEAFGADIFFDDQAGHCESAARHVATGHVPHGVANE